MVTELLDTLLKNTTKGVIVVNSDCNIDFISKRAKEYLSLDASIEGVDLKKIKLGNLFHDMLKDQGTIKSLNKYEIQNYDLEFIDDTAYISSKLNETVYKINCVREDSKDGIIVIEKELTPNYQQLLEVNSDLIAFVYSEKNIELKYVKDKEFFSKNLLNKVHYEDLGTLQEGIKKVYTGDVVSLSVPCRVQIDDKWRVYELTIQSESQFSDLPHSFIIGTDITSSYLSEQRRLVINRILRHDIRNDMNVIKGYAEVLSEEHNLEAVEKILRKSDKLINLTNEIREIDKDLNRVDRRLRKVNLNKVINNRVTELQEEYSNVLFRVDLSSYDKIIGNTLIKTAIKHLLVNSIIHNDSTQKVISINSEYNPKDNTVDLIIKDNGPGIDMSVKRIIESGIETPLEHTTGLGLWIVKWIVKLVDGKLSITNRKNQTGAKVRIRFHYESTNIEEVRTNKTLNQSEFNTLPGLSDSDSNIRTTTRGD